MHESPRISLTLTIDNLLDRRQFRVDYFRFWLNGRLGMGKNARISGSYESRGRKYVWRDKYT